MTERKEPTEQEVSGRKYTVAFKREGDWWVCLSKERDFCAQGRTISEALSSWHVTVLAHEQICEREGGSVEDVPPTPDDVWEKFVGN